MKVYNSVANILSPKPACMRLTTVEVDDLGNGYSCDNWFEVFDCNESGTISKIIWQFFSLQKDKPSLPKVLELKMAYLLKNVAA